MKEWAFSDHHFNNFYINIYSDREYLHIVKNNEIFNKKGELVFSFPVDEFKNESDSSGLSGNELYNHWQNKLKEKNPVYQKAKNLTVSAMNKDFIEKWNNKIAPEDKVYYVGDFAFPASPEQLKRLLSQLNGYKILIKGNHDKKPKALLEAGFNEVYDSLEIKIKDEIVVFNHYPFLNPKLNRIAEKRPNILPAYKKSKPSHYERLKKQYDKNEFDNMRYVENFIRLCSLCNLHLDNPEEKALYGKIKRVISRFIGSKLVNKGQVLIHGHTHSNVKRRFNMINMSVEAWNYEPASFDDIYELIKEYREEVDSLITDDLDVIKENQKAYEYYSDVWYHTPKEDKVEKFKSIYQINSAFKVVDSNSEHFHIPQEYCKEWYSIMINNKKFIDKKDLIDQTFYKGSCRNASLAVWDSTTEQFYYLRSKFGSEFIEPINHVMDDNGFDLFIPKEVGEFNQDIYNEFVLYLRRN